jgi:antitoxin ParD1/3/4
MPTRNVVLTDRHEHIIDTLVSSGRYQNASEVLRDGLRLVEERETLNAAKLEWLREAARMGMADLDDGRFVGFPSSSGLAEYLDRLSEDAIGQAIG